QSYALYPTMTVAQNMSFGPRIAGVPKAQIEARVNKVAEMLRLSDLLHRKPANLSGGQRQRVAIGRALVRQAQVLLFDEPLSNLDAKLRTSLRRELKELHAKLGATMVYVTHDQVEAMTLASRIAVMKGGSIQQIAPPDVVYGRPANAYVAGFLGSPSINLVQGQLDVASGTVRFKHSALDLDVSRYAFASPPQAGQPVLLGIRPEDLSVRRTGESGGLAAKVRVVEPMGPNQVLWLGIEELDVGVVAEASLEAQIGDVVYATVNTSRISLFDAKTEVRL
ncbi:MAG: ABC transporter ATP-binding protein, partial [Burkholderiales bacterium]